MDIGKAEIICKDLMAWHGLDGWRFEWDRAVRRFGGCHSGRKTIYLSQYLVGLNEQHDVIDTIIHEIAHALSPERGHGKIWKAVAISLGDDGQRCYGEHIVKPKAKWLCYCPNGCFSIEKNRRLNGGVCRKCRAVSIYKKNS